MTEKVKIKQSELNDIYEIENDSEEAKHIPEKKKDTNSEFEVYTEQYDEEDEKVIEETHG